MEKFHADPEDATSTSSSSSSSSSSSDSIHSDPNIWLGHR